MKFTARGRQYATDQFGVVNQLDHRPFIYDDKYCSTYDTEAYKRQSELLQALRLGFVTAAHGREVNTLLDCGYGNGAFMTFAKQHVPYVYGVDVTGINVPNCYIMPEFVKADVTTFFDAFEHIPDLSFIKELHTETVVISLPWCHLLTEGVEWFETKYKHFKPDEHLHHFNEHSLAALMSHYGWQSIALSSHEDIVRKSAHGLKNILSMAFKRK